MRIQGRGRAAVALLAAATAVLTALLLPRDAPALVLNTMGGPYSKPVHVTSQPNNANRLFVVQRDGLIRLTLTDDDSGTTVSPPFLDLVAPEVLSDLDPTGGGEQGLLSMAFAPNYPTTPYFFVAYTTAETGGTPVRDPGDLVISRYSVSSGNPNLADLSSRRDLLVVRHPPPQNHNAGQLQFGPGGFLYISTGDGGSFGDPLENAQNLNSLSGKLLRIDPLSSPNTAPYYTIPASNPFVGVAGLDQIWSYGLRNPWRFSFDRATGALVIGDVGQGLWEEVDYEPAAAGGGRGDNFGWDCREGAHSYNDPSPGQPCPALSGMTEPVFEYGHTGGNCSVTGGYVVRDPNLPSLNGRYLFGDFCTGQLVSMNLALPQAIGSCVETPTVPALTTFGEDAEGGIYLAHQNGVKKITSSAGSCVPPPLRCGGLDVTITGTDGPDTINGTSGRDVIATLGGADTVTAGRGNDVVCTAEGADVVAAGAGHDVVRGDEDGDTLAGNADNDVVRGLGGNDDLFGGDGVDTCNGGDGSGDTAASNCEQTPGVP